MEDVEEENRMGMDGIDEDQLLCADQYESRSVAYINDTFI
jgi:hypothetical protein